MIKTSIFYLCLLSLVCSSAHPQEGLPVKPLATIGDFSAKTSLEKHLRDESFRLDFYYTVEMDARHSSSSDFFLASVKSSYEPSTIDDLINQINQEAPNFNVYRDKFNPKIVHLVQKSLRDIPKYSMDRRLDLKFSGSVRGLVDFLSLKVDKQIVYPTSFISGNGPLRLFGDTKSTVNVNAHNDSARSLLSNYLTLSQYSRMLWISSVKQRSSGLETWVVHSGQSNIDVAELRRDVTFGKDRDLTIPFSAGEVAYLTNPNDQESENKALDFVKQLDTKDSVLQVRWAMLFLGKIKSVKAIPVLLDHINYEYYPSPLLTEQYPAVQALIDIGEPSAEASLRLLPQQKDQKKLILLIEVVKGIYGEEKGSELIQNTITSMQDDAQKNLVMSVLR